MIRITVPSAAAMEELGHRLGGLLREGDLVVLRGELGAGKTTLTRGIGDALGVRGPVTSPTFVLARTHPRASGAGAPLVHVDAYRLGSARELDDLDLDWERSVSVVEWGDGLLDGVAESWLRISIAPTETAAPAATSEEEDAPRDVTIEPFGPRWSDPGVIAELERLAPEGAS